MALSTSRIIFQGQTEYAHEREAIEYAIAQLPDTHPYHLWALVELLDPSSGRLYELDMLVLGYSALYLVEIKSGPGIYEGDHQDWYRTDPDTGRRRYMENPYRLTNHKSKVLRSLLERKMKNPKQAPWVQPLIFLSAENIDLRLASFGNTGVVTRDGFARAVTHHEIPGVNPPRSSDRINEPRARDIAAAMKALGIQPRKGQAIVGQYQLGEMLQEGPGYQDRLAHHQDQSAVTRRMRTYLVPQQTSVERRQQLVRAAKRESNLLWSVREHPHVLTWLDYHTDAPLGPTVAFESFEGAVPLDAFLRQHPDLDFLDRVSLVEQLGHAVGFCHRKDVIHGALSPEAVLVRRHPDTGSLEIRLFNFQLGRGAETEGTSHWSALASEGWALYQAPELYHDPSGRNRLSDMYGLGALAHLVFTGKPPGDSVPEVLKRVGRDRSLDPRAVDDGIQEPVAELIALATALNPIERYDDVDEWTVQLVADITAPEPEPEAESPAALDPLEARKDDVLGEDLIVRGVLGQGASARVLQVDRLSDERTYALKVPLSPEHDERLEAEAQVLSQLRHPRIVQLIDRSAFSERPCLLLTLAGTQTLYRYLAKQGSVSLDLAARYGEDLLSALEYLEEQQVMHRDIKPANLGVGSLGKSAAHLTLFDFSLANTSASEIGVGTAPYRDPYLPLRGKWDFAAERWSAAVILHEMLTGVRPAFDGSPFDEGSNAAVAAERFDPSVRDALVEFFERALARDPENRFSSALEMRRTWVASLEAPERMAPREPSATETEDAPLSDAAIAAITPETLIEALPLSPRARNALDRAGLQRAEQLLDLPDNRLSAIRGIGTRVAKEILALRNRWRDLRSLEHEPPKPFFAGYRGDDLLIHTVGGAELEPLATALRDAGLRSLAAVAAAPSPQVRALAKRHGVSAKKLRALLDAENQSANERARPSTLEGWVDAFLAKRSRRMKYPRLLYGLDGDPGALSTTVRELAAAVNKTTAAIYLALGKARDQWSKHGALAELRAETRAVVDAAGGALPLADAAEQLLALIPHDAATEPELLRAQAAALFRVVIEADKERPDGLQYLRLEASGAEGDATAWVCASAEHGRALKALGAAADALAAREVLAGQGETARVFAEAAEGTPLAALSPQRLADLAARASTSAARSSRLEIYPRSMAPDRALALSASILRGGLKPADVVHRVQLRYPEAAPLPTRPELDALLAPHGLHWSTVHECYQREGSSAATSLASQQSSRGRTPTALPSQARSMEPEAVIARQFDERLRSAVERRNLRVLGVRISSAEDAALQIARQLEVAPIALDVRLHAAIQEKMAQGGIRDDAIVHAADREGAAGSAWPNLMQLVQAAADQLATELFDAPRREPLLLVQPGLLARYRLTRFLTRMVEAAKDPEMPAILLLVPGHDTGGVPTINGELPIPGLHPSQSLWVAMEWLRNRHNEAA